MEITGYHYSIVDGVDCKIKIQDGIIGVYPIKSNENIKINQPQKENKWKFRKRNWTDNNMVKLININPIEYKIKKYTHTIEYKSKNEIQKIFIHPTAEEVIEINSQLKKYWIQKEYIIVGFIFVLIAGLISWLIVKLN